MQTITLNVEDEAVDKVLSMLESVADDVKIVSKSASDNLDIQGLAGIFYPYTNGEKLTDQQIKEAIIAGAVQSGMAGFNKPKRQAGLLTGCVAPPEFYQPLDDDELAYW